jgi:drug/metabolite transporter (DMT)-like permease
MSPSPHPLRGIALMVLAVSTFACLDATSKYLTTHYPVPAIVWARYFFQMALMLLILGPRLGGQLFATANLRLQIIRGVVLTVSSLVFLSALARLPMAEAASIAFVAPMLIAVLAGPFLRETVPPRTWLCLAGGFAGVLLIIRPGSAVFTWAALLPLLSALLMAIYQMMTRRLAGRDRALTTLFYPALVGTALVPLVFPLAFTLPREPLHAAMFCALGVLGGVGHFFLIRAHHHAAASTLGPFMYAQLFVVLALGWLVFGQLPDALAFAGMLTIAASGLLLVLGLRGAGAR